MVATPLAILTDTTVDDLEGRYEFVDELGDGASSKVFLGSTAPHEVPEREVAIKVMDANALAADVELLATVQAEVAVLKRVAFVQRPPPRVSARHRSMRMLTSVAFESSSAMPPPTASGDDAVAFVFTIVTLDMSTMLR